MIDDHRVLAAALGHQRRQRLGAGRHHPLGRGGRAREGDLVDPGPAERGPGLAEPGDQRQDVGRRGPRERVDEPRAHPGGQLARLEHDGVAGREGVADGTHRGEGRIVPRPDHPDDAVGQVRHVGPLVGHEQAGRHPASAQHPGCVARRPVDVVDDERDLQTGVVQRFPRLGRHHRRQRLGVAGQHPPPTAAAAPRAGRPAPVPTTSSRPPAPAPPRPRPAGHRRSGRWPGPSRCADRGSRTTRPQAATPAAGPGRAVSASWP